MTRTDKLFSVYSWLVVISFIVAMLLIIFIPRNCKNNLVPHVETINLYSGYNDNKISDSWSIFGGSIYQTDVVYYWTDTNGVLEKHHVEMDKSTFIEDGGNYVLVYTAVAKNNFLCPPVYSPTKYEFHVPEGSVAGMYEFK